MRHDGTNNLIPFSQRSKEEARENGAKGGRKSGETRRRQANFRKTLNALLTANIDMPEWTATLEALGLDSTLESAVNAAMIQKALKGDVKAYEAIARYAGQEKDKRAFKDALDLAEQEAKIDLLKAQAEQARKKATEQQEDIQEPKETHDPHDYIIPEFWEVLDDTEHMHKVLSSGRAGTKSSMAGIKVIDTITRSEPAAVVVLRKRHNKLRKTVYKEVIRAITRLGYDKNDYEIGVSPMQIRCKATGNIVYFAGSDSIDDTKGIIDEDKPIVLVVLDELTEFFDVGEGEEELSNIEATFVRGNDESFEMYYLYNPPKNPNAPINLWRQKMELRPDALCKHVDYRDVPIRWIGKKLVEAAERLREIDYKMYRWVWLGEAVGIDEVIYYMFGDSQRKEPKATTYKLIGAGVDYGQQNATTYQFAGLNINARRLEGLTEFYHSGRESGKQKSPSEYAQDFIDTCDALYEKYFFTVCYVFIDPSAQGLAEEIKRLARKVKKYNIIIKDAENDVKTGIQRCQKCFTFCVTTVSESQPNLIRELGRYEYDKESIEKGLEKPVKIDDHCCDAWRYLIMGMWSKIKNFLPFDNGSEE